MKICVVMFYDDKIKYYGDNTYEINKRYCAKYNIEIIVSKTKKYSNRPPQWERLPLLIDNIDNYDYLIWIDADAFFINDSENIIDIINKYKNYNFIFSNDIDNKNINSGVFIIKNNNYSKEFLNMWGYDEYLYKNNPYPDVWDQGVLIYMYENNILDIKNNSIILGYGILQYIFRTDLLNLNTKPLIHHMAGLNRHMERYIESKNYLLNNNKSDYFSVTYTWEEDTITFLEPLNATNFGNKNCRMYAFGIGYYNFINTHLIKADFGNREHLIQFNEDYTKFCSTRKDDNYIVNGELYIPKNIPKIIMQTSIEKTEQYIIDLINKYAPDWKYIHFTDSEIIQYFNDNPIEEFPNIIDKFNSFTKGQHKADLFRYYFLYINGGIFLDSDAMLEVNINDIIKNFDSIFVSPVGLRPPTNQQIFNGFIATFPKNNIIYDALKHAYNTDDSILVKHYHYFCEELLLIYLKYKPLNSKIYREIDKKWQGYGGSIIIDDYNEKLLSHYWHTKKIPDNKNT